MKRPIQWSRAALDDLADQIRYIAQDNPAAARRVAQRVRAAAAGLGDMAIGRPGRVSGTYELGVVRLPYVIAYAILQRAGRESVLILRVIHTRRDWPDEEWPQ